MTTQTTTLADFLLARIAEDEADAADCQRLAIAQFDRAVQDSYTKARSGDTNGAWNRERASAHIGRWHPARVLAECEAKRRIVAHIETVLGNLAEDWHDRTDEAPSYEYVLLLLAQPYADHPEFREDWRVG